QKSRAYTSLPIRRSSRAQNRELSIRLLRERDDNRGAELTDDIAFAEIHRAVPDDIGVDPILACGRIPDDCERAGLFGSAAPPRIILHRFRALFEIARASLEFGH